MPEIPIEAAQAATDAMEWEDGNRTHFSFKDMAEVAVKAAAPVLAAHIAALLDVHARRLQQSAREAARAGADDRAERHTQRAAAWAEAAHTARTVFATGGADDSAAIAARLAEIQAGQHQEAPGTPH
jgi:hypothetical protein